MARHAQPRQVAELKGADKKNPQRYRLEPPKTALPLGTAPEHMTDAAKAVWFELETYAPNGVLAGADRLMLETADRKSTRLNSSHSSVSRMPSSA